MIQQAHRSVQRRSTLADVLLRKAAQDPDRAALTFLADADTVKATLTYTEQEPALCSETLAVLLQYTSASTAKPRGEMLTHEYVGVPGVDRVSEAHNRERFLEGGDPLRHAALADV